MSVLRRIILLAVVLSVAVFTPVAPRADAPARLHYVAYAAGLRVLDIGAAVELDGTGYAIDLAVRTVGLFSALVDGESASVARGTWQGDRAVPSLYDSHGRWRGEARQTTIAYQDGQPMVRALLPGNEDEREPVPTALQANTVDSLTAMAVLVRMVATTGRCDGGTRVFDGRRLSQITVHTAGPEVLARSSRSIFQGPALRCEFEGRLLAGFRNEDNRVRAARPQHGIAWLAVAHPGGPVVPVQVTFSTRFFTDATMYLQP